MNVLIVELMLAPIAFAQNDKQNQNVTFIVLGGQKYQHDDSLGPCASNHHIVYYFHLHMIRGGSLMESFAGLLQGLRVLEASECFVEVDARFRGVLIPNSNVDTEQQSTTTIALEGHQMTALDIPERPL